METTAGKAAPRFSFFSKARSKVQQLALFLVLACALVAGAYVAMRPPLMLVAAVARGTVVEAVYASGTVEAKSRVDLRARVAGPLRNLTVREGSVVEKDQLVARIDAPVLEYEVQRGQADLSSASERAVRAPQLAALVAQLRALEAQLAEANDELRRQKNLHAAGAVTPQQLQRAETAVASLVGQIDANKALQIDARIGLRGDAARHRAILASLQDRARDTEVRSPMAGTVIVRRVEEGEIVSVNQTLLRVGDLRHLWIEASVDEADVGRLRVGMPAAIELNAFAGRTIAGHITQILPDGDRERKSFQVDIDLDEPVAGLLSGMTAEVNIVVKRRERALLIPADAVENGAVWVVDGDDRAERRVVKLGIRDMLNVEVLEGLSERERVVVGGKESDLRPGRKVRTADAATTHTPR